MGFLGLFNQPSSELAASAGKSFDSAAVQTEEDIRQKETEEASAAKETAKETAAAKVQQVRAAMLAANRQTRVFTNEAQGTVDYYKPLIDGDKYNDATVKNAASKIQEATNYRNSLDQAFGAGQPPPPPPPSLALRTIPVHSDDYLARQKVKDRTAQLGLVSAGERVVAGSTKNQPKNPVLQPDVVGLQDAGFKAQEAQGDLERAQQEESIARSPEKDANGIPIDKSKAIDKAKGQREKAEQKLSDAATVGSQYHSAVLRNVMNGVYDPYYGDAPPSSAMNDLIGKRAVQQYKTTGGETPLIPTAQIPVRTMTATDYADPQYRQSLLQQIVAQRSQHNVASNPKLARSYDALYQLVGGAAMPPSAPAPTPTNASLGLPVTPESDDEEDDTE